MAQQHPRTKRVGEKNGSIGKGKKRRRHSTSGQEGLKTRDATARCGTVRTLRLPSSNPP
jgi:hypothetical protein